MTSFIGREQVTAEVEHLLRSNRLLSLTGTGGCGKTRLALRIARDLVEEYPAGIWLVELAALTGSELVPDAVAAVLGPREVPHQPIRETIIQNLREKRVLLVLDNCEHLIDGCARFTEAVLTACPQVRILTTSREVLRIAGEVAYRVPSLALPPEGATNGVEDLLAYGATRLFVDRAHAVLPSFRVDEETGSAIREICQRLDGIPLAIELAAAQVMVLSVLQIAAGLSDRFRLLTRGSRTALPRQQTLRASIDWSYDLLSGPEKVLFRRLAVFVGGWSLEAAEAVAGGTPGDVLACLGALVEKSLVLAAVRGERVRYRFLETIQAYGQDRLRAAGEEEAATRARHAAYYLALLSPNPTEWFTLLNRSEGLAGLERDRDNYRAALRWFAQQEDVAAGVRLIEALSFLWTRNGPLAEGKSWLARFRSMSGFSAVSTELQALALIAEWRLNEGRDLRTTRATSEELLALGQAAAKPRWVQFALTNLAMISLECGALGQSREQAAEALALARGLGDLPSIARALLLLGDIARLGGDDDQAQAYYEESQTMPVVGWLHKQSIVLGFLAVHRGQLAKAAPLFREGLFQYWTQSNALGAISALVGLASVEAANGWISEASRLLGVIEAALERTGVNLDVVYEFERERVLRIVKANAKDAAIAEAWAEGRARSLEDELASRVSVSSRSH